MPQQPKPGDLDLESLRRAGAQFVESVVGYHSRLERRRCLPDVTPAEVRGKFTQALPEEGEAAEAILRDWNDRIEPLLTAVGSPRHFPFVNGSGSMIGIFADALAATTNTNAGAWKLGPAATEIERQSLRWIAEFIGYPRDTGGLMVTGGTMANYTGLLTALRDVAPYDTTPDGLQDPQRRGRFLVYMSDHEGHISITRVVDLMNLGRNSVRKVPSKPDFTIDVAALDRMIAEDKARGDIPFCVVAQLGSVNVGCVDALEPLADVCQKHGLWLHGDGACGLLGAGVPETRALFKGIERADSLSFDPHKWLGVPYDCGVVLIRDFDKQRRTFSISAPYLKGIHDAPDIMDYLEYGPEMSRGFRALKLWMTLRFYGQRGLRESFAHSVGLVRHLHDRVVRHPDCQALHDPVLYLYCFQYVPAELAGKRDDPETKAMLDSLNQQVADEITRTGLALVMTTKIRGRVSIRMSVCSQRTTTGDIDETFDAVVATGRRLLHAHAK